MMRQLTLIRHGESQWNHENRFTGWADVDLTETGLAQMQFAGRQLQEAGLAFDVAYTSVLKRCIRSQWVLLDALDCMWVPQVLAWRLNERHYGALTGMRKPQAEDMYGHEAVWRWRRFYDCAPPALPAHAGSPVGMDRRYARLAAGDMPLTESLHDTVRRVQAVWDDSISVALRAGQRVLVVGHGNCLRALTKLLENLSDQAIVDLEVPNAAPVIYELDAELKPVGKRCLPSAVQLTSGIL